MAKRIGKKNVLAGSGKLHFPHAPKVRTPRGKDLTSLKALSHQTRQGTHLARLKLLSKARAPLSSLAHQPAPRRAPRPSNQYAVLPGEPFGSAYEKAVWFYIAGKSPYWTKYASSGAFLNSMLGIALYVGHLNESNTSAQTFVDAQLRALGYKIVRWGFYTLADAARLTPEYYARDIGA